MRTYGTLGIASLALAGLALLSATTGLRPALARGANPSIGGPIAGPLELSTEAEVLSTPLGSLLETTLLAENHGGDPALVMLIGRIVWPDGSAQLLRYGPPVTIDSGGALIVSALSPVPADAGSGTGTFTVTAFVGALGHGGRGSYGGRLIAQSRSSFVLP